MSEFVAGTLGWILAELLLTGVLFILYVSLRRFMPVAADRYYFLKLAFAVVVVLPWLSFPWDMLFSNETPTTTTSMFASTIIKIRPAASSAGSFWEWVPSILVVSYFTGVALFLTRVGSSLFKLRMLTKQSQFAFAYKGIDVRVTEENIPPATFGLVTPIILIPRATLEQLSDSELQMILLHERHHIDRRDYVFNLLKAAVNSFLVFSPFIHKLAKTFVEDMELSCDAFVVSRGTCSTKDYGRLLLRLTTETRPRMDLVYSGLFVSNSFISRRITAMKSPNLKTRRLLSGAAFAFFAIIVGPTVASMGLENAVERAIVPGGDVASGFAYEAKVISANDKTASASGTLMVQDNKTADIRVGALQMQVTPRKVAEGWKFAIEVRDTTTNSLVSSANIITDEKEGAQIRTENNDSKSGFRSISLSFSPVSAKTSKSGKSLGAKVDGDMVTLNFTEPTNIKDIIKTMAQVSGKNIILNRDIDATVQVVSQHPISKTEAYKAFVSALELAGLEALDEGKAIRIVKKPSAG